MGASETTSGAVALREHSRVRGVASRRSTSGAPSRRPRSDWRSWLSRIAKMVVAAGLIAALLAAADWRQVFSVLRGLDRDYLLASLLLFLPQTMLSGLRWRALVQPLCRISVVESLRQVLAASALNLIIPSKLGDLTKATMLPIDGGAAQAQAGALAVYEKAADLAVLLALLVCGVWWPGRILLPTALVTLLVVSRFTGLWRRVAGLGVRTLILWMLHLGQIHLFLLAAGVPTTIVETLSRVPWAIFAGLVPVAWCGIGTRDSALVWLYADIAPAPVMAAVGLLTALRYLVPGAVGIPLLLGAWSGREAMPASGSESPSR